MFAPRGWLKRPIYRRLYSTLASSQFFDAAWYRRTNMGLFEKLTDPVWHYLEKGWKSGLNPSPKFDTDFYISHNNDVASAGINPLFHFVEYGAPERRAPIRPGRLAADQELLEAAPLRVFEEKPLKKRITLVLDDNSPTHPVLGHEPVIVLAHTLAEGLGASLRVVSLLTHYSRHSSPGLSLEWLRLDKASQYGDVPYLAGELWLATSWSSMKSLSAHSPAITLVYLALGCEMCLLPAGPGPIHTAQLLNGTDTPFFIAGNALGDHLQADHGIAASEDRVFARELSLGEAPTKPGKDPHKRVLSFLATPQLKHTLFSHGIEVLESTLADGVLREADWEIRFFGTDLPSLSLMNSVLVTPERVASPKNYHSLLRESDIVMAFDATGISSAVIEDAKQAGARVVTNATAQASIQDIYESLSAALRTPSQKSGAKNPRAATDITTQKAFTLLEKLLADG